MALFNSADELYFTDVDFPCAIVDLIHRGALPPDLTPAHVVLIVAFTQAVQDRIANDRVTPLPIPAEIEMPEQWARALLQGNLPADFPLAEPLGKEPPPPVYETFLQDLDTEGI
jgi:hypothetical protein